MLMFISMKELNHLYSQCAFESFHEMHVLSQVVPCSVKPLAVMMSLCCIHACGFSACTLLIVCLVCQCTQLSHESRDCGG